MIDPTLLLVLVVILALAFDFSNGWHDSANAIATVVSTHVLTPGRAVLLAAVLNIAGAFMSDQSGRDGTLVDRRRFDYPPADHLGQGGGHEGARKVQDRREKNRAVRA